MRKPLALFAAASLSAGVFAYLGYDSAVFAKDDQQKSADVSGSSSTSGRLGSPYSTAGQATLPQGTTKAVQADEVGIRQTITQVTVTVLKEDGIKQLTSYLASSDRQRLTNLSGDQVNDKIKQFQETFKQKYNKDFQPDQTTLADQFKDLTIVQGEVSNPALLSNWPVDATGKSSSTSGGTGSSNLRTDTSSGTSGISSSSSGGIGSSSTSADRSSSSSSSSGLSGSSSSSAAQGTAGSSKVEKGYGLAIVTFPASHGAPEVNVSLIRESSATGATGAAGSSTGTGSSSGSSSTGTGISGSSS